MSIARPAETFIALRTVCRHIEKIPFLAPDDVVLQPVEKRIGSLERARPRDSRVHNHARKILRVYFAGPAAHRDITKPLKSKMRLERFRSLAFGGVANRFLSRAQIGGIEISRFVEHFRVTQGDGGSGRSGQSEADPAHHVLSHVEDRIASGRFQNFHRRNLFHGFDRRSRGSYEFCFWCGQNGYRLPILIVESGFVPAGLFEPRVVGFAVIDVGFEDRTRCRFPSVIAANDLLCAVLVSDDEVREERQFLAVAVSLIVPSQPSAKPTVA